MDQPKTARMLRLMQLLSSKKIRRIFCSVSESDKIMD